ncbi:unnamed protein product [Protopolystoma xenopodis]|uniref:Uncharacterized protein n=1 Tax=Protopolystoma xenopodis TaxID=117903 RepID=A0A448XRZ9_9PLAT|nr:unnamed protein product [Protopolystoma xenopodis]
MESNQLFVEMSKNDNPTRSLKVSSSRAFPMHRLEAELAGSTENWLPISPPSLSHLLRGHAVMLAVLSGLFYTDGHRLIMHFQGDIKELQVDKIANDTRRADATHLGQESNY